MLSPANNVKSSMNWAKKIKELRYRESIKQDALAAQLGVSQASISIWERGVSSPPHHVQEALRNLYGATPSERLLNAIRSSILINPNPCALFVLRDGRPAIDVVSDTGVLGDFNSDPDQNMRSVFGTELEQMYPQLVESGLFKGAINTARLICNARLGARNVPVTISLAPFSLDQEHWFVRIDLRVLTTDEAAAQADGPIPHLTMIPAG